MEPSSYSLVEVTPTINNTLLEARKLSKEGQLTLLQGLVLLLKKSASTAKDAVQLSALVGVGIELWDDTAAIVAYLNDEWQ